MIDWILIKLFIWTLENDHAYDICIKEIIGALQEKLVYDYQIFYMRYTTHIINLVA